MHLPISDRLSFVGALRFFLELDIGELLLAIPELKSKIDWKLQELQGLAPLPKQNHGESPLIPPISW